jgi:hypothetical protein
MQFLYFKGYRFCENVLFIEIFYNKFALKHNLCESISCSVGYSSGLSSAFLEAGKM